MYLEFLIKLRVKLESMAIYNKFGVFKSLKFNFFVLSKKKLKKKLNRNKCIKNIKN